MTKIPANVEINPLLIDSAPNEGPTMYSLTILAGAGKRPAFNTLAKSLVSSTLKLPEIDEIPFGISP